MARSITKKVGCVLSFVIQSAAHILSPQDDQFALMANLKQFWRIPDNSALMRLLELTPTEIGQSRAVNT
ncbi:MAG: hypothetical protein ABJM26_08835 [Anderseniella sp.]